jgi:hemerythrin
MPLMKWNTDYSVRVQEFDNHHQQLFTMVNDLNDAMQARKGKEVLGQVLLGLAAYTERHFAAEEAAMKRTKYPDYVAHADEHRKLVAKVRDFMREYESGNALVSIDLLIFLRDWLQKHILITDHKYATHLNANGVS